MSLMHNLCGNTWCTTWRSCFSFFDQSSKKRVRFLVLNEINLEKIIEKKIEKCTSCLYHGYLLKDSVYEYFALFFSLTLSKLEQNIIDTYRLYLQPDFWIDLCQIRYLDLSNTGVNNNQIINDGCSPFWYAWAVLLCMLTHWHRSI